MDKETSANMLTLRCVRMSENWNKVINPICNQIKNSLNDTLIYTQNTFLFFYGFYIFSLQHGGFCFETIR